MKKEPSKGKMICAIVALVSLGTGYALGMLVDPSPFSRYQNYNDIKEHYEGCKKRAPKDFDCILVPMMVSNEVAEQVTQ